MAIYQTLSLKNGGGILPRLRQAAQAQNTATVLIGIGGTGIDALRAVKTQVHRHLLPDAPDAARPEYAHIRFLGIDTEEDSAGFRQEGNDCTANNDLLPLDHSEFFSIAVPNVDRIFCHPEMLSLRPELSWLYQGGIGVPPSRVSSGGIRQVGRFMMMDHSAALAARLEQEIRTARRDLVAPELNIHILAGLSGGTGSGCFLDICYLVRSLLSDYGLSAIVSGYFYLPDVSLAQVPPFASGIGDRLRTNGCAALRELDYCMGLPGNGGAFTQEYQNRRRVDWREPPVDFCFLLGASDEQGTVIPNAYRHAIDVTADHLLGLLGPDGGDRQQEQLAKICMHSELTKFHLSRDPGFHSNIRYCSLGGAAAGIPLREMDTYLASRLFARFEGLRDKFPSRADVDALAIQSFARDAQSAGGIYDALLRELRENAGDDYTAYMLDWKFVRDYGNAELVTSYTDQTAKKLEQTAANARRMMDPKGKDSLLGRLRSRLEPVIRDIDRGPFFAQRMLSATREHDLLNLIDGFLQENHARLEQEIAQSQLRRKDYETAKSDFDDRRARTLLGDSDVKRFRDYELCLMQMERNRLALSAYEQMGTVLETLRKQVEGSSTSYYARLSRVVDSLLETAADNRNTLAEEMLSGKTAFPMPLVTVKELRPILDAEVDKLNIPVMMDNFMGMLLAHENDWLTGDEDAIARLVTDFVVGTAFRDFYCRSVTGFLQDKYGITDTAALAQRVLHDCLLPLAREAQPLLPCGGAWPAANSFHFKSLTVPYSSTPLVAAVQDLCSIEPSWQMERGAPADRITAREILVGFPLWAHVDCPDWERAYAESLSIGRHSYEGKPIPGMPLDDWRKLPPLIPDWERRDSPRRDSEPTEPAAPAPHSRRDNEGSAPAAPAPHSRQDNESTEPARPAPQSEQAPPNETE